MRPVAGLICVMLLACSDAQPALVGATAFEAPSHDEAWPMPTPNRARRDAAVRANERCVGCHIEAARQWSGSHHQRANVDAAYRRALSNGEAAPFCRGCHAPEALAHVAPSQAVSELGVACVTCHVTAEGVILAAPGEAFPAPHAIHRSASFASSDACAGCHEFRFPATAGDDDGAFMQTTIREHRSSAAATSSCASCHMPIVDGRRSHAFANVRDPAWLRQNLDATAERHGSGLTVTLSQPRAGHAFPTGDLFRRLEVGAEARDDSDALVARSVRHLARHFEVQNGRRGRQLVRDDRVFDEPRRIELELDANAHSIRWWVRYQRVSHVGNDPTDAAIESSVELHSGVLP